MSHNESSGKREPSSHQKTKPGHGASLTRRELLQGKLWKLLQAVPGKASTSTPKMPPLVMRYPKTRRDLEQENNATESPLDSIPSIQGISIAPVPVSSLTTTPPLQSAGERTSAERKQLPTIPVLRPPGAVEESQFLEGCTRCNECAAACPHQAIVPASQETLGIVSRFSALEGTPIIIPDLQACLMCEDFPCIASCEPQVLTREVPVMIGTARITEHLCIAYHGTTCTVCVERCPVEGAIRLDDGKPTVEESTCTGCGVCRYVCPAPENAVLLMPTFTRPRRSSPGTAVAEK